MSLKKIKAREKRLQEQSIKKEDQSFLDKCNSLANEMFGEELFGKMKQDNKGLHFLPLKTDTGEIKKMALMKFADPRIDKLCQLAYIRTAMRECFVAGDKDVFEDDDCFAKVADAWVKILEGKKMIC